eukprot:EG_transcript_47055
MNALRLARLAAVRGVPQAAQRVGAHALHTTQGVQQDYTAVHFRLTPQGHPLKSYAWKNPTQNHVWSEDEVDQALSYHPHHQPQSLMDRTVYGLLRGAYHTFNFLTRYNKENPTPQSVELRLIFLESI